MRLVLETVSPEETRGFGATLVRELPEGAVVALVGELGAGKTVLVQGAARALGIRGDEDTEGVTSPTFVLVREHRGRLDDGAGGRERTLVHVDAHRLKGPGSLRDIGSDDFLGRRGVAFVEWADRVEGALPRPYLRVRLGHLAGGARRLEIEGVGRGGDTLVEAARRAVETLGDVVEGAGE